MFVVATESGVGWVHRSAADALPRLAQLNRDMFVLDEALESTVRLDQHRGESDLVDLDLGGEDVDA